MVQFDVSSPVSGRPSVSIVTANVGSSNGHNKDRSKNDNMTEETVTSVGSERDEKGGKNDGPSTLINLIGGPRIQESCA